MPASGYDNYIYVTVLVKGRSLDNVSSIRVTQRTGRAHHEFEIRLTAELTNNVKSLSDFLSQDQSNQGETATITINQSGSGEELFCFSGLITEVGLAGGRELLPTVVIRGYDPAYALRGMQTIRTFTKYKPSDIIAEVLSGYAGNGYQLKKNAMAYDEVLPYCVQYRETDFDFIHRLAAETGNWLYYTGSQMAYGAPDTGDSVVLQSGASLHEFDISVKAQPVNFGVSGYNYTDAETVSTSRKSPATQFGNADILSRTIKASKSIYPEAKRYLGTRGEKDTYQKAFADAAEGRSLAGMAVFTGTSTDARVKVGGTIEVKDSENKASFGSYLVTELDIEIGGLGGYQSKITALPAEVQLPVTEFPPTVQIGTQIALVADTEDPESMGRVRLKLPWAPDDPTPWVRVVQPYAGNEYGFLWIPEIGDEVLVAFEDGRPELPYVLGSLYNGNAKQADKYLKDNQQKVIRTRGGNEILFNDTSGEETITIQNGDGSTQIVLTMNGTPTISIKAEEIKIEGQNISIKADKKLTLESNEMQSKSQQDTKISGTNVSVEAQSNAKLSGTSKAEVSGAQVEVKGQATAKVSAAQASLEGQAQAVVKAAMVMIN